MTDLESAENPLLIQTGLPRYDLMRPEHVVPAVREMLADLERRFQAIEANVEPTWLGLMSPLEAMSLPYERTWQPVGHLMGVKNSPELRKAHEEVLPEVVAFGLKVSQSKPIYDGLKALREGAEWESLPVAKKRAVRWRLIAAEQAGVGLPDAERARFNEISQELSKLSSDFSNHVLDATKAYELIITDPAKTEGWPASFKALAAQSYQQAKKEDATPDAGPWRVTLDGPSFTPFMQHHRDRSDREAVYRAFMTRASSGELDNTPLIDRILSLRKEQATLLGYKSYAEYSLSSKMAKSPEAVQKMFDELALAAKPAAAKDLAELNELAKKQGETNPLAQWDVGYWAERLRESRFEFTDEQLRPYFPLPRVLEGLFSLSERLFGIAIERDDAAAPKWHDDVQYFRVRNEAGEEIAGFYLDPYSRPADKRGGAWMNECVNRRILEGKPTLPVVHLVCNGTPPVGSTPSLMSFGEVETLFHEFGHGLQGMLTVVDEADVSGLSGIEWDAVEIASQFMENWCLHEPTLRGMTKHVETGEPLPHELFAKLKAAKTFRAGSMFARQLIFGQTDMKLHGDYDPKTDGTPFEVFRGINDSLSPLPALPDDRFLCSFGHIFAGGYSAGYYSYKWSEVLSADAFSAFEEAGLEDEAAVQTWGRKIRDTLFALGGSEDPQVVYRAFRGRDPSTEALLRHNGLLKA